MAFLVPKPISNSLGHDTVQTSVHSPQPVHFSGSTNRAFFKILTLKLPGSPSTSFTSEYVSRVMFSRRLTSIIFGDRMQIEQSIVGKVLSSWDILPPMLGVFSTREAL